VRVNGARFPSPTVSTASLGSYALPRKWNSPSLRSRPLQLAFHDIEVSQHCMHWAVDRSWCIYWNKDHPSYLVSWQVEFIALTIVYKLWPTYMDKLEKGTSFRYHHTDLGGNFVRADESSSAFTPHFLRAIVRLELQLRNLSNNTFMLKQTKGLLYAVHQPVPLIKCTNSKPNSPRFRHWHSSSKNIWLQDLITIASHP